MTSSPRSAAVGRPRCWFIVGGLELEASATLDGALEVRLPGLDAILQRVAGLDVDGDFPFLAAFANDRYSSFPLADVKGVPT
jgi:hypothetical protein